jgi:hypothetical protein
MMKTKCLLTLGTFAAVLLAPSFVPTAAAKSPFLSAFVGQYPTATQLFTCGTCHNNFNGPSGGDLIALLASESEGGLNPFGRAFAEAGGENNPARALGSIENQDADRDGTTNIEEIVTGAGFFPGYNCSNYSGTANAPADLAFLVDPTDIGCGITTTTVPTTSTTLSTTSSTVPDTSTTSSTITTSTTTSPTTSTTLLPIDGCGAPVSGGVLPSASDCLFILGAAVGTKTCEAECLCAPKGTLPISASDALICLQAAVGESVALDCPCGSVSTSTTSTSTSTTTSTSTSTSSTSSTTSSSTTTSSTTTTMPNAVDAGKATYGSRCSSCHKAGTYDTIGFATDLKGKSSLLIADLGALDPMMSTITLSQLEITNLTAFLNSL